MAQQYRRGLVAQAKDLVLSDPGPALMFDDRVYKRGALTLHALRRTIGDVAFFDLLRAWAERRRFGTATTADFRELAATFSEKPLDALFDSWLVGTTVPRLPH